MFELFLKKKFAFPVYTLLLLLLLIPLLLNEAENREQEQFTDERLLDILANTAFESSQQTIDMLRAEVEKHRDGAEPNDDLTMLCVKVISNKQDNQ